MAIPRELQGQKYVSLTSFRKNGVRVATPVWFGEDEDKIYVMTRSDSGKYKRIRNNPHVLVAPCTMRGKITGPTFAATARILPPADGLVPAKRNSKEILADANYVSLEQEECLYRDRRFQVPNSCLTFDVSRSG